MTPTIVDYGHREADKELFALTRRLHMSYRQARVSLLSKIDAYLEEFEKEDAEKRALYDSGEMSHEAFIKWRQKMISDTRAWRDMAEQLAEDMTHQNQIAASMIDDTLPGVYALNHNYGTYEAEKGSGYDTTYTMYDKNTVKRLLKEKQDLLPHPSVPIEKDKLWNRQHLQSALLQGILTGEPMKDIAKRFQSVTNMTESSAMRNARTAVTGAENAGRIDSYIRAEKMGIKMKQMWMATLDGRTRDSHAMMDGEQQEVGKPFSNGCRYPGDPKGAPAEIYNCRCTLVAVVEGADPYNPNLRESEYLKEQGLTYDEWKQMHGEQFYSKLFKNQNEIMQGSDISSLSESFRQKLSNIAYNKCSYLSQAETREQIINILGGGDLTKGSCASVALAYAGRVNGIDVCDFRDGDSQAWFANKMNKRDLATECGIAHEYIMNTKTGWEKLKSANLEDDVEYLLGYAGHMAVVRKTGKSYDYLELQSNYNNGWHKLNAAELRSRFGATDSGRYYYMDIYDVRTCTGDKFFEVLGYINTLIGQEAKGRGGTIK